MERTWCCLLYLFHSLPVVFRVLFSFILLPLDRIRTENDRVHRVRKVRRFQEESGDASFSFQSFLPSRREMAPIPVSIKHNAKKYDLEIDPTKPALDFKAAIYSLTGVEPEKQKVNFFAFFLSCCSDLLYPGSHKRSGVEGCFYSFHRDASLAEVSHGTG
jgi:hypothetical protein